MPDNEKDSVLSSSLFTSSSCASQAHQQLEIALSFSSGSADAASIKTAIERLSMTDVDEDDEL